jgi:hypothetical protein
LHASFRKGIGVKQTSEPPSQDCAIYRKPLPALVSERVSQMPLFGQPSTKLDHD